MKDLRILCFGASLVEGYTQRGSRYTPYATPMRRKLEKQFPDIELHVMVDGMSGDKVTEGFKVRMKDACELFS
jgi:lysophospholipase L1-like esterase